MAEYTKYKVGDKVKVRKDLNVKTSYYMFNEDGSKNLKEHNSFIDDMADFCEKNDYVVTINDVFNGQYRIEDFGFSWVDEMFEGLVGEECDTTKFEAFLREVADFDSDKNYDLWKKINYLTRGKYDTLYEKKKAITELVEFYRTYKSTKKHTMTELKEILGYDFELVED